MSALEQMGAAVTRRYGDYVDSTAYWRDKRRYRRWMREACLACVEHDLKEFRGNVVSALEFMGMDELPSAALADVLHWLRLRLGYARADFADWQRHGMSKQECRRYGFAIEVAECLVETIHLEDSHERRHR